MTGWVRVASAVVLLALYGCGDDGRGGDGDGDGGDGSGGTGLFGSGGSDDGSGGGIGLASSGGSGDGTGASSSASTGTGEPEQGTSCAEIWDCYENCPDTDCTVACHEAGSPTAQEQDNALWECIFVNDCGAVDWDCVAQFCGAEQQACFGG